MKKKAFEIYHIVTFEETNVVGNVYYVNYFSWQGRCREMFLREYAPDVVAAIQSGELRLVTAHASCDYTDEFLAFDEVRIQMSLNRFIPYGVSLGFEYSRKNSRVSGDSVDEVIARGQQDIKFLRKNGGRWDLFEIPQPLIEVFRRYE